jgi:hypothetical protein
MPELSRYVGNGRVFGGSGCCEGVAQIIQAMTADTGLTQYGDKPPSDLLMSRGLPAPLINTRSLTALSPT